MGEQSGHRQSTTIVQIHGADDRSGRRGTDGDYGIVAAGADVEEIRQGSRLAIPCRRLERRTKVNRIAILNDVAIYVIPALAGHHQGIRGPGVLDPVRSASRIDHVAGSGDPDRIIPGAGGDRVVTLIGLHGLRPAGEDGDVMGAADEQHVVACGGDDGHVAVQHTGFASPGAIVMVVGGGGGGGDDGTTCDGETSISSG